MTTEIFLRRRQSVGCELARHLIGNCSDEGGEVVNEGFTASEATLIAAVPLALEHLRTRLRTTLD
ncbi:hypothetical protein [Actinomadura coerulea]|uniref:hypothetical protein n=1 Tax=Actinomadura coerulea TaxID=46159 RepID=UPI00342F4CB7